MFRSILVFDVLGKRLTCASIADKGFVIFSSTCILLTHETSRPFILYKSAGTIMSCRVEYASCIHKLKMSKIQDTSAGKIVPMAQVQQKGSSPTNYFVPSMCSHCVHYH